jgi:type II restriction enzyme
MPSAAVEQAIADAQNVGRALLKFISPNDVGLTGSHQKGYYLPKGVWQTFSTFPPTKGVNNDQRIEGVWQDGRVTHSTVKWYGTGTRSEYRLTGFNRERNFPFITHDCVGSLLLIIPESMERFLMYVFDLEDDIEDVQAGLGVEVVGRWALYDARAVVLPPESEDECISRRFREFAKHLSAFPATIAFAGEARLALEECVRGFVAKPSDDQLLRCVDAEYRLFQLVERKVCEKEIVRLFTSVDDFLKTAQSILQRRKARAGRSLEHHVEHLLRESGLPFEMRVDVEGTKPDVLIPSRKAYLDPAFPDDRLFAMGVKTTCKDRWRQVLREAPRVKHKHILTLQQGISPGQLAEMKASSLRVVVPAGLHKDYPPANQHELLSVAQFIDHVRDVLSRT